MFRSKSLSLHGRRRPVDRQQPPSPTDKMHVRKPSSSSSSSSSSSTGSTASASNRHDGAVEFDPLCLHPTFHAPPRLSERAFIAIDHDGQRRRQPRTVPDIHDLDLPPASPSPSSPTPHAGHDRTTQPAEVDYFRLKLELLQRPQLQRSHWSESTIRTVDGDDDEEADDDGSDATTPTSQSERLARPAPWQNFSYKRNTVPRRPPMKTADSIENFIKRGGWKRRGIVFQQNEGTPDTLPDRTSSPAVF